MLKVQVCCRSSLTHTRDIFFIVQCEERDRGEIVWDTYTEINLRVLKVQVCCRSSLTHTRDIFFIVQCEERDRGEIVWDTYTEINLRVLKVQDCCRTPLILVIFSLLYNVKREK